MKENEISQKVRREIRAAWCPRNQERKSFKKEGVANWVEC